MDNVVTTNPLISQIVQTYGDFQYTDGVAVDVLPTADPSASPLPETQPAVTVSNNLSSYNQATPNGPATETSATSWNISLQTAAVGAGTETVTFTDGSTGAIPVVNYWGLQVNCDGTLGKGIAFDANGNPSATTNPASSDVYTDGPASQGCGGSWDNESESVPTLHFPGGYMVVAPMTPDNTGFILSALTTLTAVPTFVSQGNTITDLTHNGPTIGESIVAKAANGVFFKYMPLYPENPCVLGTSQDCSLPSNGMAAAIWATNGATFSQ